MTRPNIIFIVADDLGTFDVPFTQSGSEIITPTLSRLAGEGLVRVSRLAHGIHRHIQRPLTVA